MVWELINFARWMKFPVCNNWDTDSNRIWLIFVVWSDENRATISGMLLFLFFLLFYCTLPDRRCISNIRSCLFFLSTFFFYSISLFSFFFSLILWHIQKQKLRSANGSATGKLCPLAFNNQSISVAFAYRRDSLAHNTILCRFNTETAKG